MCLISFGNRHNVVLEVIPNGAYFVANKRLLSPDFTLGVFVNACNIECLWPYSMSMSYHLDFRR